jgi:plasmid stabilization system protein ParE
LEALEAELTRVQRPSELVERRSLVVAYRVARCVQQDQVSRAPQYVRKAHVAFSLLRVEPSSGRTRSAQTAAA